MERSGLINKVKIKLDEYTPEGVSLPFDDYIGPMLDESAREILERGPMHLLTPTALPINSGGQTPTTIIIYAGTTYPKAYIPVPTDYVRLHEVKFPLWERSVKKAISTDNPAYAIQENNQIVGGYGRPSVVILSTSPAGGAVSKYLECSKVVASVVPSTASYIKTAKPEELNDLLAESLSWLCACKILLIGGQGDKAKLAYEQFANSLSQT